MYKRKIIENSTKRLSIMRTPYICANIYLCKSCGKCKCIAVCPNQVIAKEGTWWKKRVVLQNVEKCINCKKCIKACKHGVFLEINN